MKGGTSGWVAGSAFAFAFVLAMGPTMLMAVVDANGNGQSDVWEMIYGAPQLPMFGDADGDGWANGDESVAGTDPKNARSFPRLEIREGQLHWQALAGKNYAIFSSGDLVNWAPLATDLKGTGETMHWELAPPQGRRFFRLQASDADTDGDGVNDWEEMALGFDATRTRTERREETDKLQVGAGLVAGNSFTVSVYDESCSEGWPDPAVFVIRRSGGLQPVSVPFALAGSATAGIDYTSSVPGNVATFAPGQREVFIEISPLTDAVSEPVETVTLTAGGASAAISIRDAGTAGKPSAKEAARFLIQAAFGPDQDAQNDPDMIPENVEEVMAMGIEGWIDDQLTRPIGKLQPMVQWQKEQPDEAEIYNDLKQNAWWGRAMGLPKLRPDATVTQAADPLRQRVAFALSQIFVISDRMEDLAVDPEGMSNYYDTLLQHSFGNYRDLLRDVSLHPCMGLYLSHLGNRRADPVAKTFPDENYAREIMQLFSIGLWMLNPDGSRQLDPQGQPIPTYDNSRITEFARIFTGLAFGGTNVNFGLYPRDFTKPMKGWDAEHDLAPKTLLSGVTTPQRTASAGNTGTATMADVNAAMDNLLNHPNVGPFIGRQLIQRLVTSNPSPAYIARVSAAFNQAPRGDLGRTVKAILMDPEARDPAKMSDPTFGKLREPFLKAVNVARAFNAASEEGWYYLDAFVLDHVEEPMKAPSVFNFYLPSYVPPGALAQAGLVAPEFQIINASSGVTAPNYFWGSITGGLHRWGSARPERTVKLNLTQEMLLNVPAGAVNDPYPSVEALDPDPLIRRLDLVLTGGTLTPRSCQIIHEALARIGPGSQWDWPKSRLKLAIYLIVASPEFAVQH